MSRRQVMKWDEEDDWNPNDDIIPKTTMPTQKDEDTDWCVVTKKERKPKVQVRGQDLKTNMQSVAPIRRPVQQPVSLGKNQPPKILRPDVPVARSELSMELSRTKIASVPHAQSVSQALKGIKVSSYKESAARYLLRGEIPDFVLLASKTNSGDLPLFLVSDTIKGLSTLYWYDILQLYVSLGKRLSCVRYANYEIYSTSPEISPPSGDFARLLERNPSEIVKIMHLVTPVKEFGNIIESLIGELRTGGEDLFNLNFLSIDKVLPCDCNPMKYKTVKSKCCIDCMLGGQSPE